MLVCEYCNTKEAKQYHRHHVVYSYVAPVVIVLCEFCHGWVTGFMKAIKAWQNHELGDDQRLYVHRCMLDKKKIDYKLMHIILSGKFGEETIDEKNKTATKQLKLL